MASIKYIGYVGGAAIAAGVGAAIAVAGQGTAHADADSSKPASSASKSTSTSKDAKSEKKDSPAAGPKRPLAKVAADVTESQPKPKFDPSDAIDDLKKQFAGAKPKAATPANDVIPETSTTAGDTPAATADVPSTPLTDLATKAAEAAAVLVKPVAAQSSSASARMAAAADSTWFVPNNAPSPWDLNPFRFGDPIPQAMPDLVWTLEQSVVNAFSGIPLFQPVVREGFEFGYRLTQMIPWVNVVVPLTNVVAEIPNLSTGDPVVFKDATQRIINNLLVTIHPISVLFYGYDVITDALNLEYEGQQLKSWFYSTSWDVIDFFHLLHNPGESGLPLSPNSAGNTPAAEPAAAVTAAAVSQATATTDVQGSDPFRPDDPWPTDMPAEVLNTEKAIVGAMPPGLAPIVREAYEAVYRASQVVPYVNVAIPLIKILQAVAGGGGSAVQTTVNQLLLTTQPVSLLYYGFDEITDLLNIEEQGYATKQQIYATIWDLVDPSGAVHTLGESGI